MLNPLRSNKNTMPETDFEINISRVRRAIDFWPEFTGGERLVAGVIADHFNPDEGYAFPSYQYLQFVYGFSSATIASTVEKMRAGLMTIDQSGGNSRYVPNMEKVESILADWKKKRKEWNEIKAERRASRGKAASRGKVPASRGEVPASLGEVGALREVKPNDQPNAQPKAQHERATAPASGKRGPFDLDGDDGRLLPNGRLLPKWASHPQGLLVGDWTWDDREFQPAIDLLGFDEYELDAEIDRFIKHHRDERRHDWNPVWLEWIQTLNARQSSDGQPEPTTAGDCGSERHDDEDPPF